MKGILLAGGTGSRLGPLTAVISKQLLPVYNKPMIYYPLSTLMLAGVKEVLIVATPKDLPIFRALLGAGANLGIRIEYIAQEEPRGLADGLLLGEKFSDGGSVALMLGDNILYGSGAGLSLTNFSTTSGAAVFAQQVADPSRYGVVELDADGTPLSVAEKPKTPKGDLALTGLYFFDATCFARARNVSPSARGEFEITDVLLSYLTSKELKVQVLQRGTAWLDTGTIKALSEASEFVRAIETRQGVMIGCLEEIAWKLGYIDKTELAEQAAKFGESDYSKYLRRLASSA